MRFFGAHLLCGVAEYQYRLGRLGCQRGAALRRAADIGPLGINEILEQELLGRLAMSRGRFAEAAERLRPLASLAERAADVQFIGPVQATLTELALWEGRPDDAASQVATAIRLVGFTPEVRIGEVYALGVRANADAAELARARRAAEPLEHAIATGEALIDGIRRPARGGRRPSPTPSPPSPRRGCVSARPRGRDCIAGRAPTPGSRRWRHGTGSGGRTWPRTRDTARRRRDSRRRATAVPRRRRFASRSRPRRDSMPCRSSARSRALAMRGRLTLEPDEPEAADGDTVTGDAAPDLGLTPREQEVLALVAYGRTNRQIADELFISENTAGVHVSNILGKLDVKGRGEAAALAYRLGLVDAAADPRGPAAEGLAE